jgi:sugar PTS system EIIA component
VALRIGSPVAGRLVGLARIPDPVFAEAMVGPGTAIDPLPGPGEAAAPIAGNLEDGPVALGDPLFVWS